MEISIKDPINPPSLLYDKPKRLRLRQFEGAIEGFWQATDATALRYLKAWKIFYSIKSFIGLLAFVAGALYPPGMTGIFIKGFFCPVIKEAFHRASFYN